MERILYIKNALVDSSKKVREQSFSKFSIKEQTFFIKRLSFLIKAGIPIIDSLQMIRDQSRSRGHSKILDTIIYDVSSGQRLSTSLEKFRNVFGDFSINIIEFGETTGILSENLEYLATELQKRQALKKKIVGAFVYPAVITLATFGIVIFLVTYLFPKIMPIFSSLHLQLPLSTRMVIFISNFMRNHGISIIITIILFFISFIVTLRKSQKFHFYYDKYILKIPIIGEVIKQYNLANSLRTIGLLLKSGITLSEALPITAKTSSNLVYKKEFENIGEIVDKGARISVYLDGSKKLFPDVIAQIISAGERSGNLSNSLIYLSEMYENEVEDFTKNISNIIEPVLMIFMGFMVGFIAISIITPIYSITQNLQVK